MVEYLALNRTTSDSSGFSFDIMSPNSFDNFSLSPDNSGGKLFFIPDFGIATILPSKTGS